MHLAKPNLANNLPQISANFEEIIFLLSLKTLSLAHTHTPLLSPITLGPGTHVLVKCQTGQFHSRQFVYCENVVKTIFRRKKWRFF